MKRLRTTRVYTSIPKLRVRAAKELQHDDYEELLHLIMFQNIVAEWKILIHLLKN